LRAAIIRPRVPAEIEATQEIFSEKGQLRLSRARVSKYVRLAKLWLGQAFQELDLKSQMAQREENILRLNAERARLDARLGDLDIRIHEVKNAPHVRITNELRETTVRLRDIEVSLPSAREVRLASFSRRGLHDH
jgi:hypothetical protein